MKSFIFKRHTLLALLFSLILIDLKAQTPVPVTGYGYGKSFNDVLTLSDGTLLIAGGAENLSWVPAGVPIDTLQIPNNRPSAADLSQTGIVSSSPNNIGYILHTTGDFQQLLRVTAMPQGLVPDVVKVKTNALPSATTGDIFISGRREHPTVKGYYIAKLNANYLNGNFPTACSWTFDVRSLDRRHNMGGNSPFPAGQESDVRKYQPWDVTAEGKVYFVLDREFSDDWCAIHRLKADGTLDVVENWRVHWTGDGTQTANRGPSMRFTPASSYTGPDQISSSGIILKLNRNGHPRSATQQEFDSLSLDENGNSGRKGTFPDDFFFDTFLSFSDGNFPPASAGGYTGMRPNLNGNNTPTPRCVALTVDRTNGDFYFGYSVYSTSANSGPHDFEPAIVAMDSSGRLKWWARGYQATTEQSPAQQHIDFLSIDYQNRRLIVAARTFDDSPQNFWRGNQIAQNPGGSAYHNAFSGPTKGIYVSWLGSYGITGNPQEGKILRSTYIGEAADTLIGTPMANPLYDGFANLEASNTTLANTETEDLKVLSDGSILWAGITKRVMTTTNALFPMLKYGEGQVRPQPLVRIYNAGLDSVKYSTLFSTIWNDKEKSSGQTLSGIKATPLVENNGLSIVTVANQIQRGSIGLINKPSWADSIARLQTNAAPAFAKLPILTSSERLPRPDTILSTLGQTLCQGQTDTFFVRKHPLAESYTWSVGAGWEGFSLDSAIVLRCLPNNIAPSSITVAYLNNNGSSKQFTLLLPAPARTPNPVAGVTLSPNPNQLCIGQPFSITLVRQPNTRFEFTNTNPLWVSTNQTDTSISFIVPTITDTSSIFVKGVNDCGSGPWRRYAIPIPLSKPPKPVITDSSGFLVSSVPTGLQWFNAGLPIHGATQRLLPRGFGFFTVVTSNRCGADTSDVIVIGSANKPVENSSFICYPNPITGNRLNVELKQEFSSNELIIRNILGEVVFTKELILGLNKLELPFQANGVYFLTLHNQTQKIISLE